MPRFEVFTKNYDDALVFTTDIDDGEFNIRAYRKSRGLAQDLRIIAWIGEDGVLHRASGIDDFKDFLKLDEDGRIVTMP